MSSEKSASKKKFVPPSPEELTQLFPAYDITDFIAAGGMGAVYKARQLSEAKAMARMNHPNLMAVYDFGNVDGMLFIAMEFVKGKALYYSAHRKQIDPVTAFKMIIAICEGVAHAHDEGILHRDLKPANILLLPDATPKVGDFGLARSVDAQSRERTVFGTPGYTAPEVYSKKYPVDERSDVFSIGAMLSELLTGELPKPNSSYMVTGIDPRFDNITRKATHPVPEQRYRDTHEMIKEMRELLPKLDGSGGGPRLKTGLTATGLVTNRATGQVTSRVTASLTQTMTQPIVTGPLTQAATQGHTMGIPFQKKKSSAPAIVAILGIISVGAVIYFVQEKQKQNAPPVSPPEVDQYAVPANPDSKNPAQSDPASQEIDTAKAEKLLATTLAKVRKEVRDRHNFGYERFKRRESRAIQNFVTKSDGFLTNEAKKLDPKRKLVVRDILEDVQKTKIPPDALPPFAPGPLKVWLKNVRGELERNRKGYRTSLSKARKDYLQALEKAAHELASQGHTSLAKRLGREIQKTKAVDGYTLALLRGDKLPMPTL